MKGIDYASEGVGVGVGEMGTKRMIDSLSQDISSAMIYTALLYSPNLTNKHTSTLRDETTSESSRIQESESLRTVRSADVAEDRGCVSCNSHGGGR